MAGDRGIRAGSSGGSLTGGIAGSGGGIGLGLGNVGPAIVLPKMRKKCERSSDRHSDWKKPLPRDQIEGVESLQREGGWPTHIKSKNVGGNPDHVLICGGDQSPEVDSAFAACFSGRTSYSGCGTPIRY